MPACSPACSSTTSALNRWRSAQRRYIRSSISAQSVASVPPAPALIVSTAFLASYSPENSSSVRSRANSRPEGVRLAREVGLGLGVGRVDEEVDELLEVRGALLERAPQADLLAQALGLADDLLRGALVVPEPGLDGAGVELRYAAFLGGEVKDAPRSTGSAPRGPGWPCASI